MRHDHAIALRTAALGLAGAVVTPLAWVARAVLPPAVLPHAIAAPRRIFAASAGRVSYYEDGSAAGTPLVLLHDVGPLGCAYELRSLFDALRAERPVVAVDLPGYGFSERRREALDRAGYVRFVEELLADVGARHGRPVDVVAVGTMGEIAARVAKASRALVRSLVLVSPTGFASRAGAFADAVDHGRRIVGRALASPAVRSVAHRALTAPPVLRAMLAQRGRGQGTDPRLVAYAHAAALQPRACVAPMDALAGSLGDRYVAADVYDQLTVPVLFVHGDVDDAGIASLCAHHAGFRRAHVAGAGALPHVGKPELTVEAMRAFWRAVFRRPSLVLLPGGAAAATSLRAHAHGDAKRGGKRWT